MSRCVNITNLDETTFIAGGVQYFEYTIYNSETGELVDISDLDLRFTLNSAYGQSNFNPVVISATKKDANTFRVELAEIYTTDLKGFYLQQPVLIDYLGQEFKPSQGSIIISQSNE